MMNLPKSGDVVDLVTRTPQKRQAKKLPPDATHGGRYFLSLSPLLPVASDILNRFCNSCNKNVDNRLSICQLLREPRQLFGT